MEAVRPKKKHKKKPKDAASKTTEVHKHGTTVKPEEGLYLMLAKDLSSTTSVYPVDISVNFVVFFML